MRDNEESGLSRALLVGGEERSLSVASSAKPNLSSLGKRYYWSLALNALLLVLTIVMGCLYFSRANSSSSPSKSAAAFSADACNFGPTHHSHIVLPLASDRTSCAKQGAHFFMSHGATFFCPHTFDVKLLATIQEGDARKTLCDKHFDGVDTKKSSNGARSLPPSR